MDGMDSNVFTQAGRPRRSVAQGMIEQLYETAPSVQPHRAAEEYQTGWQGPAGTAAFLFSKLAEGVGESRVRAVAAQQADNYRRLKMIEHASSEIWNSPFYSQKAKEDAAQLYRHALHSALPKQQGKGKENPIVGFMRNVLVSASGTAGLKKEGEVNLAETLGKIDEIKRWRAIEESGEWGGEGRYSEQALAARLSKGVLDAITAVDDRARSEGRVASIVDRQMDPAVRAALAKYDEPGMPQMPASVEFALKGGYSPEQAQKLQEMRAFQEQEKTLRGAPGPATAPGEERPGPPAPRVAPPSPVSGEAPPSGAAIEAAPAAAPAGPPIEREAPPAPREDPLLARVLGPVARLKQPGFEKEDKTYYVYGPDGKYRGRTFEEYAQGRYRERSTHRTWLPEEAARVGLTLDDRPPGAEPRTVDEFAVFKGREQRTAYIDPVTREMREVTTHKVLGPEWVKGTPPTPSVLAPQRELDRQADELVGRAWQLHPNDPAASRQWLAAQTDEDPEILARAMKKVGRPPTTAAPGSSLNELMRLYGIVPPPTGGSTAGPAGQPVGELPVSPDRIRRFDKP